MKNPILSRLLSENAHALERECLRVTPQGNLSQRLHPKEFGSKLTNPFITTDFSESQLELVAPVAKSEKKALDCLLDIHLFVNQHLGDELMWSNSMPCRLPSEDKIPLASYGTSREGQKKLLYRKGLTTRYGKIVQTVSGIHYNFSFSENLWKYLHKESKSKKPLQEFINDGYFQVMRAVRKYSWLITYLFGATPASDKTYRFRHCPCESEQATSIRLSSRGYNSKVQMQTRISFNSLSEYLRDMRLALTTPHPHYVKLGLSRGGEDIQMNYNILQLENEYYSSVRPKQPPQKGETVSDALEKRGVKYIEVRCIDIDPFSPLGISEDTMYFLNIFLTHFLLNAIQPFTPHDLINNFDNQEKVALFGHKKNLKLKDGRKKVLFSDWANQLLNEMMESTNLLGSAYSQVLKRQFKKIADPNLTPSAIFLHTMKLFGKSFVEFSLDLAKRHHAFLNSQKTASAYAEKIKNSVEASLLAQEKLEVETEMFIEGYEDLQGSTQMVIGEALRRGVEVEVLDGEASFIRLKKGKHIEYVKAGNKTSRDSYITEWIMKNKGVTKKILKRNGVRVPEGRVYRSIMAAKSEYGEFAKMKCVVKPVNTNYGIAVSIIEENDFTAFVSALEFAFKHDKSVIVEEFIEGLEYRFLLIGEKVVAILHREPANVVGDGKHTVHELVKAKNEKPRNYKITTGYVIQTGPTEQSVLKKQSMNFSSIPKKNQKVYLRENSNVHTGGDPIDFTDEMPAFYKNIAIRAAKAVQAKVCGVDMIISNLKSKAADNYAIIEANFNPAMQMHDFPLKGKNRHVENAVLDLLGF